MTGPGLLRSLVAFGRGSRGPLLPASGPRTLVAAYEWYGRLQRPTRNLSASQALPLRIRTLLLAPGRRLSHLRPPHQGLVRPCQPALA